MMEGVVFSELKASQKAGGPTKIKDPKIGLIQFCLTAPKTDVENQIVVNDYAAMDRLLREERKHILDLCKKVAKTGCNCLLIQKSILRDATNDLTLHYLAKLKIMVVTDVERNDIEFISKTLGCTPIAHIDQFTADKLGKAAIAEETSLGHERVKVVRILTKMLE